MSARHEAHDDWVRIIDGRMNDAESRPIYAELQQLSPDVAREVRHLIGGVVDTAVHHLLWEFERAKDIGIYVERDGALTNVNELSDGLTGDFAAWKNGSRDDLR